MVGFAEAFGNQGPFYNHFIIKSGDGITGSVEFNLFLTRLSPKSRMGWKAERELSYNDGCVSYGNHESFSLFKA